MSAATASSPLEPQQAFLELGRLDFSTLSLTEVLARVAELTRATVPGADEVSVTLVEGEEARSVAFTGDLAVQLDERQYERGFGPCMDAAITGNTVIIKDTEVEDRYPEFGSVAARAGVRSTLSVGMPVPQRTVGGLNLYADLPDAFDDAAVDLTRAFASYGAVALTNAALVESKTMLATHLERAMASRAVIEQAKGIIMARLGCDAEQAFGELVRRSQHTNRKLNAIARDIVAEVRTRGS
jgi:GAF domain-containing protein